MRTWKSILRKQPRDQEIVIVKSNGRVRTAMWYEYQNHFYHNADMVPATHWRYLPHGGFMNWIKHVLRGIKNGKK